MYMQMTDTVWSNYIKQSITTEGWYPRECSGIKYYSNEKSSELVQNEKKNFLSLIFLAYISSFSRWGTSLADIYVIRIVQYATIWQFSLKKWSEGQIGEDNNR